jgi:hypothetical protein
VLNHALHRKPPFPNNGSVLYGNMPSREGALSGTRRHSASSWPAG